MFFHKPARLPICVVTLFNFQGALSPSRADSYFTTAEPLCQHLFCFSVSVLPLFLKRLRTPQMLIFSDFACPFGYPGAPQVFTPKKHRLTNISLPLALCQQVFCFNSDHIYCVIFPSICYSIHNFGEKTHLRPENTKERKKKAVFLGFWCVALHQNIR